MYINAQSNHPPNIIKQLPLSIEDRLRDLSSSKKIFEEAAIYYQDVLDKCGYKHKLKYEKEDPQQNKNQQPRRNRARNIIWFNPPFSKSVSTNVAKYFLKLIDKHFPPQTGARPPHKFRKIFNRNNLKVSYSCMPNVKAMVNGHNKKILSEEATPTTTTCSCPMNAVCPMNGNCLSEDTLYSAKLTSNIPNYTPTEYLGMSAPPWKQRLGNHKLEFNHKKYVKCEIAKEVWNIKDQGGDYNIQWRIIGHAPSYNPIAKKCCLCIAEKLLIAEELNVNENLLNKRDELISKCRHRRKYTLETCS